MSDTSSTSPHMSGGRETTTKLADRPSTPDRGTSFSQSEKVIADTKAGQSDTESSDTADSLPRVPELTRSPSPDYSSGPSTPSSVYSPHGESYGTGVDDDDAPAPSNARAIPLFVDSLVVRHAGGPPADYVAQETPAERADRERRELRHVAWAKEAYPRWYHRHYYQPPPPLTDRELVQIAYHIGELKWRGHERGEWREDYAALFYG